MSTDRECRFLQTLISLCNKDLREDFEDKLRPRGNILVRLHVLDSWSMCASLRGIWCRTNICAEIKSEVQGKVISYLKMLFKGRVLGFKSASSKVRIQELIQFWTMLFDERRSVRSD